jgi:hypothetical protein
MQNGIFSWRRQEMISRRPYVPMAVFFTGGEWQSSSTILFICQNGELRVVLGFGATESEQIVSSEHDFEIGD